MLKAMHHDVDPVETSEWIESLEEVMQRDGSDRASFLLAALQNRAQKAGVDVPLGTQTPYLNSIPLERQPEYPGDRAIERKIKSIIRWNALAMVQRANRGGHISTYASAATLLEVGFNHFFRGPDHECGGDFIYFQGHSSPGIYSRAFLEGRLTEQHLTNFRGELAPGGGLSSYPHPWLMPNFWQFPTVSMGLGPHSALYHARFIRYLEDRGLRKPTDSKVWCFVGDGEVDEPETLGAIHLASRDCLDNLIFVVNCNLQRLDGPVRGNGKIIQELESFFRGAGWNVLKVVWGSDWDPLLAADTNGALVKRLTEVVDGEFQRYTVAGGQYFIDHFCNGDPDLLKFFENIPADKVHRLRRGGHDPAKVYAAFQTAVRHIGAPTVVLAHTIKGYGLGEGGQASYKAHNLKKLGDANLKQFRELFDLPIPDDKLKDLPFYRPDENSPEMQYVRERRAAMGGPVPHRKDRGGSIQVPRLPEYPRLVEASNKEVSTTLQYVRTITELLRHKGIGKHLVPIIPDEARTFGMEGVISQYGIYSHVGQIYTPVDYGSVGSYKESKEGQVFQEGINECGAMSSFIAAGTSYANHGVPMVPMYIYYSMFGFQRVGDSIWAAADARCRGFLLGATAGRTTLNGEGLQHQDGHSHLIATSVPNLLAYDPAYGYEVVTIILDGLRRILENQEDLLYYITLYNGPYMHLAMPEGVEEGIIRGMYRLKTNGGDASKRPQILGSGSILDEALKARVLLQEKFGVDADVWSVTSYKELRRESLAVERWNLLHPAEKPRQSYLQQQIAGLNGPFVAVSDNMKLVHEQIGPWIPGGLTNLGTDGFGRSESREALRRHFEIDAAFIAYATLASLVRRGQLKPDLLPKALKELQIDPEKIDPVTA